MATVICRGVSHSSTIALGTTDAAAPPTGFLCDGCGAAYQDGIAAGRGPLAAVNTAPTAAVATTSSFRSRAIRYVP
jgi:hypothetical protein